MMVNLKTYPKYRKSKMPWLNKIPTHWSEKKAKFIFMEIDERSTSGQEELLSVSHITGVTPRSEKKVTMFKAESYEGSKICRKKDLVINTMWAWMSALGISKYYGIVSPSYHVYRVKNFKEINEKYLDYLLRTWSYTTEYKVRSTGIRPSRLRLYPDDFLDIPILIPSINEQQKIVKYLNFINIRINKYIKNKRRLIDLFVEQRDVVTQNAIRLKETKQMRFSVVADRIVRPVVRQDDEFYTPVGLYNRGRGIFHKELTKGKDLGDSSFSWIEKNDVVFSGQFSWEGAVALAVEKNSGCIASHRYPIFRGKQDVVESAYIVSFFKTKIGHILLNYHSRGAAGRNRPLNANALAKEKIPIPPKKVRENISYLTKLEYKLRANVANEIVLIQEFRNRIISDVVTGKVDVRNIKVKEDNDEDLFEETYGIEEEQEMREGKI